MSLRTHWRNNRCVNRRSVQPVLRVWLLETLNKYSRFPFSVHRYCRKTDGTQTLKVKGATPITSTAQASPIASEPQSVDYSRLITVLFLSGNSNSSLFPKEVQHILHARVDSIHHSAINTNILVGVVAGLHEFSRTNARRDAKQASDEQVGEKLARSLRQQTIQNGASGCQSPTRW